VEVGDVVRVRNRDTFPADLLLLASSLGGQAWVNTKPVDGESDVKLRLAPKPLYVP
jgi:phospholipid-transporting ATPase